MGNKITTMNVTTTDDSVIKALATALSDACKELARPVPDEEPTQVAPDKFQDKVQEQLLRTIQNALGNAKSFQSISPASRMYIHYEAFPEELYNELEQSTGLKKSMEELGFKFYMTHNGDPHPMVTFVLRF